MWPTNEKVVPTLVLCEHDAHVICLYDIAEAKIIVAGAGEVLERTAILFDIGIDFLVVSDYELLPMDVEIAKQIFRVYVGVIGLRGHNYYKKNTLRNALDQ